MIFTFKKTWKLETTTKTTTTSQSTKQTGNTTEPDSTWVL